MTGTPFFGAAWISRAVPPSERVSRETTREWVEWASPGTELAQTVHTAGPVRAISVDLAPPPDVTNIYTEDVSFHLSLETLDGEVVAQRTVQGPQLVWERFLHLLDVPVPAAAGEYVVVLRVERGTIGWWTASTREPEIDDGVSPIPIRGTALRTGTPVPGTRLIAVDTDPAPNPWFRTVFDVTASVSSAHLAAVVLGCGNVYVNGHRIGDALIEPAVTDYDHTVLYRQWSVTHLLQPGQNEIRIEAGRERYSARGGDIWGWYIAPWHREPAALAALTMSAPDGTTTTITTGDGWSAAPGPVESERLYRGEDWVIRDHPTQWTPAQTVAGPFGVLRQSDGPGVLGLTPEPPIVTEVIDARRTVYDFGQVMTGRVRCVITGQPGATVRVTYGEQRDSDGGVVCENVLIAGPAQEDSIRFELGVEARTWEPQFGYRGFRWMQIDTDPGEFTSNDPLLEWIDTATARTFRNNLHGIPTDTPIFEKNGWTADAHLATEALLHHFDLRLAFGKWMDDHVDAQSANGAIPQIVPTPGFGRDADPAWSASAVLIPWYLYREYGDLHLLQRYESMIRRFADHLLDRTSGGLWPGRSWGDWLAPGFEVGPEGMIPIGTAMTVTVLRHTAAVLEALDRGDAAQYEEAAARTAAAYHSEYFDDGSGSYRVDSVGYRQSLNILPLAFGMVPAADATRVESSLIDDLETRTDGHVDCGAIGVRHLLLVLSAAGRDDLAITVLTRRDRPGWGAWFDEGERTLLEAWDITARSRNHYFFGSVSSWIQQRIGGLRALTPGWMTFEIRPVDDSRVTRGGLMHHTPLGDAAVRWERGAGGWQLDVTVPDGAEGVVAIGAERSKLPAGIHQLTFPPTTSWYAALPPPKTNRASPNPNHSEWLHRIAEE